MRKAAVVVLISALLFSAVAGTFLANLSGANPWPKNSPPPPEYWGIPVIIQFPENKVYYNTQAVFSNFTYTTSDALNRAASFFYLLDGQHDWRRESVKVEDVHNSVLDGKYYYEGHVVISNLSKGPHQLSVFAGYMDSDGVINGTIGKIGKINFEIENAPFPTILVATVSVTVIAVVVAAGLLVYFRKRRREAVQA